MLKLLRKARASEVKGQVMLLPPTYLQAEIKELNKDTHADQQQKINIAWDRFFGQAWQEL